MLLHGSVSKVYAKDRTLVARIMHDNAMKKKPHSPRMSGLPLGYPKQMCHTLIPEDAGTDS